MGYPGRERLPVTVAAGDDALIRLKPTVFSYFQNKTEPKL